MELCGQGERSQRSSLTSAPDRSPRQLGPDSPCGLSPGGRVVHGSPVPTAQGVCWVQLSLVPPDFANF